MSRKYFMRRVKNQLQLYLSRHFRLRPILTGLVSLSILLVIFPFFAIGYFNSVAAASINGDVDNATIAVVYAQTAENTQLIERLKRYSFKEIIIFQGTEAELNRVAARLDRVNLSAEISPNFAAQDTVEICQLLSEKDDGVHLIGTDVEVMQFSYVCGNFGVSLTADTVVSEPLIHKLGSGFYMLELMARTHLN